MKKRSIMMSLLLCVAMMAGCGSSATVEPYIAVAEPLFQEDAEYTVTEESSTPLTIEEQLIYRTDKLTITAKEIYEDPERGYALRLAVENNYKSDMQLYFTTIVNGFNIPKSYALDYNEQEDLYYMARAGETSEIDVYWYSKELEASGIYNVGQIELNLSMYDNANAYRETGIAVKTSKYDEKGIVLPEKGKEFYNQDGIKLFARYVDENSYWGEGILLYAENHSEMPTVILDCQNLMVNGQQVQYQIDGVLRSDVWQVTLADNMQIISFVPFNSPENDEGYAMEFGEVEKMEIQLNISEKFWAGQQRPENVYSVTTEVLSIPMK